MPIEKQTYLNEILVRLRRDGSIAGAHQIRNEVLVETESGDVLSERAGLAAPLDAQDVATVLGASLGDAVARIAALQERIEIVARERDAAVENAQAPPAQVISDLQFYSGLALRGLCTQAEALEAVRAGVLPQALRAFVESIADADERWAAEMLLAGAKEIRRDHPFVASIAEWAGLDAAALEAFWQQCLSL